MNRSIRSRGAITELKIPAQAQFVIVAKRAASALGSAAGFSLGGIDDLNIAVAQACDKAIAAGDRLWGPGNGVLKLTFSLVDGGIEVEVRNLPAGDEVATKGNVELERRADSYRRTAARLSKEVAVERQERVRAQQQMQRRARASRRTAAQKAAAAEGADMDLEDVAVNMIRLFVDELRTNVDARGAMRMRMVKYHVD